MAADNTAAALYYAVEKNDAERLAHLLENDGDVDTFFDDTMDVSSKSLLHICCERDRIECLRVLIDCGAKLDVRDKWGQTPLMYSVTIQFLENVKILLEACPDLCTCQDRYGKSSLHCAIDVGNIDLVRMLLQFGANVNIRDHNGFTPLMNSCSCRSQENQSDIMMLLIQHGALVDLYDYSGKRTALHKATESGNLKAVVNLIEAGVDVNAITKNLTTPLTSAIYFGTRRCQVLDNYMSVIKRLVAAGADLNMNMCESCNSLLASSQVKCVALMEFFLQNGADPDVKLPTNITAALVSASLNDASILKVLIKYNCNLTTKGAVYKRRFDREVVIDPFQMALMQRSLHLCIFMVLAGYPLTQTWNSKETQTCFRFGFPQLCENIESSSNIDSATVPSESGLSIQELLCETECQHNSHKLDWIRAMAGNARRLQDECIFVIRDALGQTVSQKASSLPLPKTLRDSVALNHFLNIFS